ncbi:MAG: arginine--tRNA ligase [Candidatus Sungbacteria bacterium]|uniref:Arginine--tRNA ligase n=1 Tax=Candidatus Sungiibacteriota bacterium TaxID=2750080 RepID=A0A9D6DS71_9BACT|nr:arginine--tRNA ligase [Candidatus Sungbacteria bacterium]
MRSQIKDAIRETVSKKFGLKHMPDFSVEAPENPEHGDYATNIALILAKLVKKPPMEISRTIDMELETWNLKHGFSTEIAPPGFINFFLDASNLSLTLKDILKKKEKFGLSAKNKKTVIIEYSSPNIAKPMGVHHLRTTIIGQALVNIYSFLGYRVLAMSFPGDWGTQFGSLIAAYKKWGNPKKMVEKPIKTMLDLYVRFSHMAEGDETLREEAKKEFKKLEDGDKTNRKIWFLFRKESFKDFNRVYKKLGIKIPFVFAESFFEPYLKKIVAEALNKKVAERGENDSLIVKFKDGTPPLLLQKSDGATLYATRDLAQMKYRVQKWHPYKIIIVVANQQTLYFEQIFKASARLGYAQKENLVHVKFGMVLDSTGKKFATREGKLIPLADVLDEAVVRAGKIVEELNPQLSKKEKNNIAETVGIGAVKFFDLAQNRLSDIVFDWNKMLNLKGASAPYIQYSYARLKSVLRKAKNKHLDGKTDFNLLKEKQAQSLARHLVHFTEALEDAAARYEPSRLAEYLLKLAEKINHFYESVPILSAEKETRKSRLALIEAATIIIENGMKLLGIKVPEKM